MKLFSEQQLIDCTLNNNYRLYGCDGGWTDDAFKYLKYTGLAEYQSYAYRGKVNLTKQNCC
jgi:hypothetical protein